MILWLYFWELYEMNNGDVGGSRGRGRGWQQPENQPRELRRPRIVDEDTNAKGNKQFIDHALSRIRSGPIWRRHSWPVNCVLHNYNTSGESKDFHFLWRRLVWQKQPIVPQIGCDAKIYVGYCVIITISDDAFYVDITYVVMCEG